MKILEIENENVIKVKKPKRKRNKKPKKTAEELREIRSRASKKGWETRRKKARVEKTPKPKTQKPKKTAEELREIRSRASKKGWETRRKKARVEKGEIAKQNLIETIYDYASLSQFPDRAITLVDLVEDLTNEQIAKIQQNDDLNPQVNKEVARFLYMSDGTGEQDVDTLFLDIKSRLTASPLSLKDVMSTDTNTEVLMVDKITGEVIT